MQEPHEHELELLTERALLVGLSVAIQNLPVGPVYDFPRRLATRLIRKRMATVVGDLKVFADVVLGEDQATALLYGVDNPDAHSE